MGTVARKPQGVLKMDDKEKQNQQAPNADVPEDVKNDPAQIYPPTHIVLEDEPIPNPDLEKE